MMVLFHLFAGHHLSADHAHLLRHGAHLQGGFGLRNALSHPGEVLRHRLSVQGDVQPEHLVT